MSNNPSNPESSPDLSHQKPDIRKANVCPPLPHDASLFNKMVYLLGIGFGSGLPKRAPGTWGTLAGLIVAIPIMSLGFLAFIYIVIAASLIGVWICHRTSTIMNVHDDPHIVWDEWVGIWFTLIPMAFIITYMSQQLTSTLYWSGMALAFGLFRFFDIIKPNPIKWVDIKVSGGLGIMLDDILAGIMAMVAWLMIVALVMSFNPA